MDNSNGICQEWSMSTQFTVFLIFLSVYLLGCIIRHFFNRLCDRDAKKERRAVEDSFFNMCKKKILDQQKEKQMDGYEEIKMVMPKHVGKQIRFEDSGRWFKITGVGEHYFLYYDGKSEHKSPRDVSHEPTVNCRVPFVRPSDQFTGVIFQSNSVTGFSGDIYSKLMAVLDSHHYRLLELESKEEGGK